MMKKKIDWKILIITSLICLIPIIFGVILYDQLPEQMAVHFGVNNEPNSFAPKRYFVAYLVISWKKKSKIKNILQFING